MLSVLGPDSVPSTKTLKNNNNNKYKLSKMCVPLMNIRKSEYIKIGRLYLDDGLV